MVSNQCSAWEFTSPDSRFLTQVTEWNDGRLIAHDDALASEEPLEIRMGRRPLTVSRAELR
jgi:hypothetical protein